jgi:hypothetical protein
MIASRKRGGRYCTGNRGLNTRSSRIQYRKKKYGKVRE